MKWGKVDFKQLKKLQDKMQKLNDMQQEFCEAAAKELAARLLAKVIRRTPVGDYSEEVEVVAKRDGRKHKKGEVYKKRVNKSGLMGGTLRRGWTSKTHEEAASGSGKPTATSGAEYAQKLPVKRVGDNFVIDIINPVTYSQYVEYGHRTRGGGGWVQGRFMLTISVDEIQSAAPKILEKKLAKWLGDTLNGK
ncbi:MAG: HK97 gp10 family phage protein [Clostridia bacterium]|nr:HK97 gp10 family phage protein [Clostridia bacterium]